MSQYAIDELKLIGIVTRASRRDHVGGPGRAPGTWCSAPIRGKADIVQAAGRTGASY